jgi:hypothetical protein
VTDGLRERGAQRSGVEAATGWARELWVVFGAGRAMKEDASRDAAAG